MPPPPVPHTWKPFAGATPSRLWSSSENYQRGGAGLGGGGGVTRKTVGSGAGTGANVYDGIVPSKTQQRIFHAGHTSYLFANRTLVRVRICKEKKKKKRKCDAHESVPTAPFLPHVPVKTCLQYVANNNQTIIVLIQ